MTTVLNAISVATVDKIYAKLIEHISDRFSDPVEATNRATDFLAKYYFNIDDFATVS